MKEKDILEFEKTHLDTPEGFRTVHLFESGKFLHAYEYSAFLVNRFSLKDIKVIRIAGKNDKAFVGFPVGNIASFIPDRIVERTEEADGHTVLLLSSEAFDMCEDTASLKKDFGDWRSCLTESSPSNSGARTSALRNSDAEASGITGLLTVMKMIMEYPLEKKTPADNTIFISDIKALVVKHL